MNALHLAVFVMALSMKALFATFSSATGLGATFDVNGFGFQPKAYVCFWNGRSEAVDTAGLLDCHLGVGASSGAQRMACSTFYDQGTTAAIGGGGTTNSGVMRTCDATGAETGRVDHDSFLADGIRFIVDDVLPANIRVMIVAFGGSDITNAFVGSFLSGTATGNQDFTGLGFDPGTDSLFMFFAPGLSLGAPPNSDEDLIQQIFGAARSASPIQQYVTAINSDDDSATMDVDSYSRSGECVAGIAQSGAASMEYRASFVQSITDGFRLNAVETGGIAHRFFAICIKGGSYHLGDLLTMTDTTTDIVESGFGFQPRGALFVSHCKAQDASDVAGTFAHFSVGACSSPSDEVALGFLDEDATGNMETQAAIEHDAVYANLSTSAAIEGLMAAQSFPDADGFTMRMSDADPSQAFVWYVAAGDAASAPKSLVHNPRHFQHMLVR